MWRRWSAFRRPSATTSPTGGDAPSAIPAVTRPGRAARARPPESTLPLGDDGPVRRPGPTRGFGPPGVPLNRHSPFYLGFLGALGCPHRLCPVARGIGQLDDGAHLCWSRLLPHPLAQPPRRGITRRGLRRGGRSPSSSWGSSGSSSSSAASSSRPSQSRAPSWPRTPRRCSRCWTPRGSATSTTTTSSSQASRTRSTTGVTATSLRQRRPRRGSRREPGHRLKPLPSLPFSC